MFKMKICKKILILLVVITLITGCRPPTSEGSGSEYRSGTKGLTMNFLSGAPPSTIYIDKGANNKYTQEIPITIEVYNKGSYPIISDTSSNTDVKNFWTGTWRNDDVIYISGFDNKIISKWEIGSKDLKQQGSEGTDYPAINLGDRMKNLYGKQINNPDGGYDILEFTGTVDLSNLMLEKYEPTFLVTACYDYMTRASPNICIDPDPFSTVKEDKVCTISDTTLKDQGAPVAITKIEQKALSNSMQFKIYFKNVGGGDVIATDVLKRCSGQTTDTSDGETVGKLSRKDMDVVKVKAVMLRGNEKDNLKCVGDYIDIEKYDGKMEGSYARLINNEGSILCNLPEYKKDSTKKEYREAFETPLYIELLYGYRNTISKKVEIIKVP